MKHFPLTARLMALILLANGTMQAAPVDFLPPVANINPTLTGEETPVESIEPVTLSSVAAPVIKTRPPVLKLDNDLGIRTETTEYQTLLDLQRTLDNEDLDVLWQATVERNPVIRFSLEKLATPPDLKEAHSSRFLNKSLNYLISGAAVAATMMPGGGAYRNMGAVAGSDALRNVINGRTPARGDHLSATEQIQLAGLVDDLKGRLVKSYHDYKNSLQALIHAHQVTVKSNDLYSKMLNSQQDNLAVLAAGSAYYKAVMSENGLKHQALRCRLQLERLAGVDAVKDLKLALTVTGDAIGDPPPPKTSALPFLEMRHEKVLD